MTLAESNRLELAKQGDCSAIAELISQSLPKEIIAKVSAKDGCLKVMLESANVPDQTALVQLIQQVAIAFNSEVIRQVKVYGREIDEDFPSWHAEFVLPQPIEPSSNISETQASESLAPVEPTLPEARQNNNFFGAMFGAVAGAAGAVGGVAVNAGGAVAGTVVGAAGAVGGAAVNAGGAVAGTVVGAAGAVGNAAVQAGGAIAGTAVGVAGAVGSTAMQATDGVGYVLDMITNSSQLQELTQALKVDWLLAIVDKVDVIQAEAQVKKLQQKYPHEQPGEIAHRVITEKAFYVGASGFANSLMPGFAAAMFAVDLAATMALQAEMTYQIASAYGLNLQEPSRKGEVLAIFGMALGGSAAMKAGLGFARNIPIAGAVIGASSNAAMLYSLGYAACQFYEAKLNPRASQVDLLASQSKSEQYLESVLDQQVIMDQILLHLVLAGNPEKTLQQLLPDLQKLELNSASFNSIAASSQNLPPLGQLVDRLNQDFAVSLMAQCEKIAQADGVITSQEKQIIDTIRKKFGTAS